MDHNSPTLNYFAQLFRISAKSPEFFIVTNGVLHFRVHTFGSLRAKSEGGTLLILEKSIVVSTFSPCQK